MATTTPNYGWDVPTSTDYVKDGATAIETLGDDIDASLFSITGGKNVGLQYITGATLSGSTSYVINGCFTSAYENYRLVISNATTGGGVNFRLANGSTPDTTAGRYSYQMSVMEATYTSVRSTSATTFPFGGASEQGGGAWDIFSPQLSTVKTSINGTGVYAAAGDTRGYLLNGNTTTTTSYDSFNIYFSGTTSFTYKLYGYRN